MGTPATLAESDKFFWHGYIDFYEMHLRNFIAHDIVEMGVLHGHSIRWLMARFPEATISGLDIVDPQPQWPVDARVIYRKVDQGSRQQLKDFFSGKAFDLIIEDGSHIPTHQADALVEGMKTLRPGGLYILEDIHTSLPSHEYFKATFNRFDPNNMKGTALSCLLALDHLKRVGAALDEKELSSIAENSLFTRDEIAALWGQVDALWLYRRAHLPDRCYHCGSATFHYNRYQCVCGVHLLSEADSMSFVIKRR